MRAWGPENGVVKSFNMERACSIPRQGALQSAVRVNALFDTCGGSKQTTMTLLHGHWTLISLNSAQFRRIFRFLQKIKL